MSSSRRRDIVWVNGCVSKQRQVLYETLRMQCAGEQNNRAPPLKEQNFSEKDWAMITQASNISRKQLGDKEYQNSGRRHVMQADHFMYHLLKEDLELESSKWKESWTHRSYLVVGENTRGCRLVNTTAQVIHQGQVKA